MRALLGLALWSVVPGVLNAQPERPNVVLIITDDQGYGDLGTTGNPVIRTPHLDAMAGRSARVEPFYVSPVCAPTRACLMTGRYNYRTRVVDTYAGRAMLDPEEVTVAEILRGAGYATGIFGKWHLGDCYPMRPIDQGFEEALVHRGGGIGQPSDPPGGEGRYSDPVLFHNGEPRQMEGYCTDIYFDATLRWIDRQHAAERPFFAYVATNCPHGPFHDVPEADYAAYRDIDLANARFPAERGHALPPKASVDRRARIFAMITSIDRNIGRLFARLDERGLTENTIVLFMLDNGPNGRRYVAGMRGMKSEVYEGGIRSPLFVQWPARLRGGHVSDRVAAHIDILPTLLDACGVDEPTGVALDGRSLLPLLSGTDADWPDRTIYIQAHRGNAPVLWHNFAARNQRWKLLNASGFHRERPKGPPAFELYDMENDPLEERDVAAEHPDVVAAMKADYRAWFEDVGSTRPDNYAPPRIVLGSEFENPVVLTRQDWRRVRPKGERRGRPRGRWTVNIATAGSYEITVRFRRAAAGGTAVLRVGDKQWETAFEEGAVSCTFAVELRPGDTDLEALLGPEDKRRGAHQVEVRRRE